MITSLVVSGVHWKESVSQSAMIHMLNAKVHVVRQTDVKEERQTDVEMKDDRDPGRRNGRQKNRLCQWNVIASHHGLPW